MSSKSLQVQQNQLASVASAFDAVAVGYDESNAAPVVQRIRRIVYDAIQQLVPKGSLILDLNCGTGIDARYLADAGYRVSGIDLSPKMISEAKRLTGSNGNLSFAIGSFERIGATTRELFNLVLSNFGGFNCTKELKAVMEEVSAHLLPGGYLVAVVMPPFSLWESLSYVVRGEFRNVFRRIHNEADATGFRQHTFRVHYHSLSSFRRAARKQFSVVRMFGLSVFSPTPQSIRFVSSYPRLTRFLQQVDSQVQHLAILRGIGDHFAIILQKRPINN